MIVCPSSLHSCVQGTNSPPPPSEPPGEIMSFGVSPVNYSDSDSEVIYRGYSNVSVEYGFYFNYFTSEVKNYIYIHFMSEIKAIFNRHILIFFLLQTMFSTVISAWTK